MESSSSRLSSGDLLSMAVLSSGERALLKAGDRRACRIVPGECWESSEGVYLVGDLDLRWYDDV